MPDSAAAATFYGKIFDPQVFHERTGVQRYYVRLGSAYLAFGPQANATPYIDHIAAGVIDFVEDDFGKPEIRDQITASGLAAPPGVLPMMPPSFRVTLARRLRLRLKTDERAAPGDVIVKLEYRLIEGRCHQRAAALEKR